MTRSLDDIVRLARNRMAEQAPLLQRFRDVLLHYEGEYVVPFNTTDQPELPPMTPLLVAEIIDNMGMRAGSLLPIVSSVALDSSKQHGRRSREYASIRRLALRGTWERSHLGVHLRRWFRHQAGYASGAMWVRPDFKSGLPSIEVRSPLSTFPEPRAPEDLTPICDVIFVNRHAGGYLRELYPKTQVENGGPITGLEPNSLWDVLEYVDEEEHVMALLGPVNQYGYHVDQRWVAAPFMELTRYPNRTGMCWGVMHNRVTMERVISQVRNVLGQVEYAAKLEALNILAQEKNVFPDIYAIGRQNGAPSIVGGQWKDGRTGEINLLTDVEQVGVLRQAPDPGVNNTIDRRERNIRTSTGLLPAFGGETPNALRTGRGIDSMMGIAVDPRIQELHELAEVALQQVNERVIACYKGYWPGRKFFMSSGLVNSRELVEFKPTEHLETTDNLVRYAVAGADVGQITVWLSQMYGSKAISLRTFREMHPFVAGDPEHEQRQVDEEDMEEAMRQAIARGLLAGTVDLVLGSTIEKYLRQGLDIFEAVTKADEEVRKKQATLPPEPTPDEMAEGRMANPAMMPGLAAGPGASMPQVQPNIGPTRDQMGLITLMKAVRAR